MPIKPYEILEIVRTLRAYTIANPQHLPSAIDRVEVGLAFATLERVYSDATIAWQRKARGAPVSPPIFRVFSSAREIWNDAHSRHPIEEDDDDGHAR
jgi:hypothetical protein